MTPFRGMGANAALHDAGLLTKALRGAAEGRHALLRALAAYERNMIDHGFAAARGSLADVNRLHSKSGLQRLAPKAFFRLVDIPPPLQRAFRGTR
jgi:2-polyprenyl-6-methoxyphenol hydroxylase-like FAD-dependent oxidoreductase